MLLRKCGAQCPNEKAGGIVRGSMIALAVFLLLCVLMAGAVSAEELKYSDTAGVLYEITVPGEYTLTGGITEAGDNETLILINASGVTLNGDGKQITGGEHTRFGIKVSDTVAGTVTIQNFKNITKVNTSGIYHLGQATIFVDDVTIGDITNTSTTGGTIAGIYANTSGHITIKNAKVVGTITGATSDTSTMSGDYISASGIYARSSGTTVIENCDVSGAVKSPQYTAGITVNNLEGFSAANAAITNCNVSGSIASTSTNAYGIVGWARQGKLTISGGKVNPTLSGNFVYGVHAYGKGNDVILKGISIDAEKFRKQDASANAAICVWEHASQTNFSIESCNLLNVTYSGIKVYAGSGETKVSVRENTLKFIAESATAFRFEGSNGFTGYIGENTFEGSTLTSYVSDTSSLYSGVWGLTPRVNVPGVAWTSDSSGYTLAISEAGSYKLTDDVTLKSMTVTADDVTISGNYPNSNTPTLTLNALQGGTAISTSTGKKNLTLQNLYITAAQSANFGTAVKLSENGVLKNSKLDLSNLNTKHATDAGRLSSVAVSAAGTNVLIDNTYIQAGSSDSSSSQCVLISGDGAKITRNELRPGKSSVWVAKDSRPSTGSVAVRLTGSFSAVITDNIIVSQYSGADASMNTGVGLDGVSGGNTVTVNGNTFTLSTVSRANMTVSGAGNGGFGSVFYVNPSANDKTITIDADGNTVKGGTYFIFVDKEKATAVTLAGSVQKNNYAGITGKRLGNDTGITVTSSIQWAGDNIEPAVPEIPKVTPTTDTQGNTVVKPENPGDIKFDPDSKTATIGDSSTSAAVIQISGEGIKCDESSGVITAPPEAEIKAAYTEAPAAAAVPGSTVTYQLNISLKNDVNTLTDLQLPTISPAFDENTASLVVSSAPGFTPLAMITATGDLNTFNSKIKDSGIELTFKVPMTAVDAIGKDKIRAFHVKNGKVGDPLPVTITPDGNNYLITVKGSSFSTYALAASSAPVSSDSSSSGNTENAFRVLFDAKGGSFVQPATGLSYGDRIAKPADPERSGYSFAGWYKDEAGTIAWVFSEDAVPGDISLYAKWVPAGTAVTETQKPTEKATAIATAGSTVKQTASVTTAAATSATTAPAGISSPTMTQAPVPLAGLLLGLLGGCVLLRRKE